MFEEWTKAFGEEGGSLLSALATQAVEGAAEKSWRVGVHAPAAEGADAARSESSEVGVGMHTSMMLLQPSM